MKSLAQIGYEAFTQAVGVDAMPWAQVVDPSPRRGSPITRRAWEAAAAALEREVLARVVAAQAAERKRNAETVKCRCGARHMKGEQHICNDDPVLVAKLAGRA